MNFIQIYFVANLIGVRTDIHNRNVGIDKNLNKQADRVTQINSPINLDHVKTFEKREHKDPYNSNTTYYYIFFTTGYSRDSVPIYESWQFDTCKELRDKVDELLRSIISG